MALLSARHSYTLPSTVIAISDVVPAHNEVKLLGHQWLYGAGGADYFAHAHVQPFSPWRGRQLGLDNLAGPTKPTSRPVPT